MAAVLDALRPAGVTTFDKPATSERIWSALRADVQQVTYLTQRFVMIS